MDWKAYSFVVRGRIRRLVLLALDSPKIPAQIAREMGINSTHVSRALKEMEEKSLVRCLLPKADKGKVYKLTREGKEVAEQLRKAEKKE